MSLSRLGRLSQKCSVLFICDLQEKFRHNITFFPQIVSVASRMLQVDRLVALSRIKQSGAFLTTSEGVILQLLQDSSHPKFKQVQKLIIEPAPDSGLLSLFKDQNLLFIQVSMS